MPDAADYERVAVAHNRVLDHAIDRGERVWKYQCAGRQSRPSRTLQATASGEPLGGRHLVGSKHVDAEMPMLVDGCPR
ncbi:hypothetical protein [Mesorhizobium sp. M2A.F.Ca.ET.067.02.1.1]|uniref:hypothetical protein n=1 Tax=Mesorhizobium sp. M2A.F.Ca.ET.067.02.1.1 TaxID=2496749 RepID=UPI001FE1029E|nr:hypothetical protein [Mesorhizobium sp. M2A.F.Ca.ET.067.02.1.1]